MLTVQEITQAMVDLRQQVMSHDLHVTPPAGESATLQLCTPFSNLVEIFLALHHKLIETDGPEVAEMLKSFLDMLLTIMQ